MTVDFWVLRQLCVVTISAGVKESSIILILSGVQHIVALGTEAEGSHYRTLIIPTGVDAFTTIEYLKIV